MPQRVQMCYNIFIKLYYIKKLDEVNGIKKENRMKRFRFDWVILLLVIAFLSFLLGYAVGKRKPSNEIRVVTTRQREESSQQASSETTDDSTAKLPEAEASYGEAALNLNTATKAELITLPGIGEVLAQRIVDYREANGIFRSVEDLLLVDGIGEKILSRIRDYITVEEMP